MDSITERGELSWNKLLRTGLSTSDRECSARSLNSAFARVPLVVLGLKSEFLQFLRDSISEHGSVKGDSRYPIYCTTCCKFGQLSLGPAADRACNINISEFGEAPTAGWENRLNYLVLSISGQFYVLSVEGVIAA